MAVGDADGEGLRAVPAGIDLVGVVVPELVVASLAAVRAVHDNGVTLRHDPSSFLLIGPVRATSQHVYPHRRPPNLPGALDVHHPSCLRAALTAGPGCRRVSVAVSSS